MLKLPLSDNPLLGRHSPRWKRFLQLERPAGRRSAGLFLVEGPKLLREGLRGHHPLQEIVYDPDRWQPSLEVGEIPCWAVTPEMLQRLSDTEHAQGVVGIFKARPWSGIERARRVLLADHLADPGNLGVLLRTAWATGVDAVLTWGGVDPLHPKVVRASAGAVFHVPCQRIEGIPEYPLIGMSPRAEMSVYEVEWPERFALVVGNEAHGLSQDLTSHLSLSLSVPMQAGCESLNAATSAAVVLFEWRRLAQRS